MGTFAKPVDREVLDALPPNKAQELAVWSAEHAQIFDLRVHSIHTCPFLAYMPAYGAMRGNTTKWAEWLYDFYRHKHDEEGRCSCAKLLGS